VSAFALADDLKGEFVNTSREGFRIAPTSAVYSLVADGDRSSAHDEGGSVITLSYFGAEKVVPNITSWASQKPARSQLR